MTNIIERNKLTSVIIVMLLIWGSLLIYLITYAQEISEDPCSICAKRMGDDVRCMAGNNIFSQKTFYENGTIEIKTEYPALSEDLNRSSNLVNKT